MINHILTQKFAIHMGIDPLYFNNLDITNCGMEDTGLCQVFWEYHKNRSYPSKMALNTAIHTARLRIAQYLSVWATDEWIESEEIDVPKYFDGNVARMIPVDKMTFKSKYNIKKTGIKKSVKIETVDLAYTDEDGDGFKETATFQFILPEDLTLEDVKTVYVGTQYRVGLTELTIDEDRLVTGIIYAYELVKPEIYLKRGFGRAVAYEACDDTLYVEQLDVIYETVDECLAHAEIIVEKQCITGCEYESIPACVKVVDNCEGHFMIKAGTYVDGCFVESTQSCSLSGRPVKIKINYLTGPNKQMAELLLAPLFELTASIMVPAHCTCDCYEFAIAMWQADVSVKNPENPIDWRYPFNMRANAVWGQTVGAIQAQQFLDSLTNFC